MKHRIAVKISRQRPDLCGPGALAIALSAFGVDVSEEELARLAGSLQGPERGSGTEHEGMVAAAEALGCSVCTKEEATIADLKYFINEEHLPVIVGWFDRDDDHYSVVIEVTDTEIVLADSSSEGPERRISRELFPKVWFDFVGAGNHKVSWGWLMVMSREPLEFAKVKTSGL